MRLLGEYELTIDAKSRLLIPSAFRKSGEDECKVFILVLGTNRKLWLYPEKTYDDLTSMDIPELAPSPDTLEFDQLYFGLATELAVDNQGRVLVPKRSLVESGTKNLVTLIGSRGHMELWNREDWESRRKDLLARQPEIELKGRQNRRLSQ